MKSLLALIAGLFACCVGAVQATDKAPFWHADWKSAHRAARKENKPIFAVLACKH